MPPSMPAVYPSPQGGRLVCRKLWPLCNLCSFAIYATYAPLQSMPPSMPAVYPSPQGSRLICNKLCNLCYLCSFAIYATFYAGGLPQPSREPPDLSQALQSMQPSMPAVYPSPKRSRLICRKLCNLCNLSSFAIYATYDGGLPQP